MTRGNTNFLKVNNDMATGRRSKNASPGQEANRRVLGGAKADANLSSPDLSETESTKDFWKLVFSKGTIGKSVGPNRTPEIKSTKAVNFPFASFYAGQFGSDRPRTHV